MIKFEKIQPGMTLYDRHAYKMGNTTMRTLGQWTVSIIDVDPETQSANVRWNGNSPRRWPRHSLEKLYVWSMYDAAELERRGYELEKNCIGQTRLIRKAKPEPAAVSK